VHGLWQAGRVAVVANVGPLVAPMTRAEYLGKTVPRPYQLFSHSDQQGAWQSGYATGPLATGWGGRIADIVQASTSGFPTVASIAGLTSSRSGLTRPHVVVPRPDGAEPSPGLQRDGTQRQQRLHQVLTAGAAETSPLLVQAASTPACSSSPRAGAHHRPCAVHDVLNIRRRQPAQRRPSSWR
jgi:uncharacterized protein (DUF1501 family)